MLYCKRFTITIFTVILIIIIINNVITVIISNYVVINLYNIKYNINY